MNPSPTDPVKKWRVGTLAYTTGGLAVLFCWLLWGDFAFHMRDRAVPPVMQLLFKKFGASDMLTGILFSSLPAALGLVIGPIVGYRSDRLRSRWGRRLPFLLIPTPFIVLSMAGLAFSPQLGGFLYRLLGPEALALNQWILVAMAVFWTTFEICCITANSVFGGLVNDVVPQPIMGRFFGLFRAFSLIAGIIFNYYFMGKAETHFIWIFLGIGALYGIGFPLMCFKVKEGEYPPPLIADPAGGPLAAIKAYFRDSFSHPYYLWFFAATILPNLATAPFNVYSVFYAKSVHLDLDAYGKYLAATYVISLLLAYPLGALADRFHPLRVTIAALLLYAGAMLLGGLFVQDAGGFAIALIAHGVLSGALFTSMASLQQRLLPRAKFTEISSASGVLNSLGLMAVAPLVGSFLDATHHAYRYTFCFGLGLSAAGVVAACILHRKFMALGGPRDYRAPCFG